jgi:hypothetical protein
MVYTMVLEAIAEGIESSSLSLRTNIMITEYKVINATYEEFHKEVAKLLSEGWQPQGGVSVVRSWYSNDPTTYYFQAFVR